ncbi:MAG: [FeFe] hydrogenase H-cluster radical SAM maturase HydG [Bacteroidales bacterium]|jgi:2-iminoacetate synthase|nr:[FeFe] hydrogenase H-cluster radical SAM maturase HydG [Bacteroidales bacterium]
MILSPEKYMIPDKAMKPFIDEDEINDYLKKCHPTKEKVREIIQKSLGKNRLSLEDTAYLLNANEPEMIEEIKQGARELKKKIYGERIVLFAPLYVGNYCANNCAYCGFKASNKTVKRETLIDKDLIEEVEQLEDNGHKRLILVYGEHPKYDANFIAESVQTVYKVKKGMGEIRRVNINAAPFDIEGYKIIKDAGIGTYQVFQETYHNETFKKVHQSGKKRDYNWRLTALDRAQEALIDDVGIGVLFGLYKWRFEVMGLLRHVNHFEAVYNIGPHTISFPRIQNALDLDIDKSNLISDDDFTKLVAILRLAVPYTGMILTAREPANIRNEIMQFGVSQIDGGTNIQMKGYSKKEKEQQLDEEQFAINDDRSLEEVIQELLDQGFIPSFCTACYRLGRTGEHFMEFSIPGFIKRYCQPNAILTLSEYLEDYASPITKEKGYLLIDEKLKEMEEISLKKLLIEKLKLIKENERDLYF